MEAHVLGSRQVASRIPQRSDERSARVAQRFEIPMLVASALVIPAIIMEASGAGQPWETVAVVLNYAIWLAFVIEVAVMLCVVPDRKGWARAHPIELIVVVLTPPFLFSALQPVRALRLLRVLRLLRLAPLARRLFTLEGVRFASLLALLTLLAGANAYAVVEPHRTMADGLYWGIGTMTTAGFGDSPATDTGKFVGVVLVLVGVALVAILTGAIAQRFLAPSAREIEATEDEIARTDERLLVQIRNVTAQLGQMEQELEQMRFARHQVARGF
jgi:voltage-gated potassium channel